MTSGRDEWRGAVIGMVLGDASLYRNRLRDGSPSGHYKFDVAHCERQRPYLEHKREILQSIFDYEIPIVQHRVHLKRTGKTYNAWKFATRVHPRLSFIGERMYQPLKRITPWALDNLTDRGMAYWWMDDGCLHKRVAKQRDGVGTYPVSIAILGVYGFPLQDVKLLRDYIADVYGTTFNLNQHRNGGMSLRLGGKKAAPFLNRLSPYAAPCMAYKFPNAVLTAPSLPIGSDDIVRSVQKCTS